MADWDLIFEVDFDTDPADTPSTWTDLSSRLHGGVSILHGPAEAAGTADLVLNNRDRALDPTNTSATFNLVPMRHARIRVIYSATTYDLYRGFVEEWPPVWETNQGLINVTLSHALTWVALKDADLDLAAQTTGERIGALLDLAGWPAGRRDIDTGRVTVQALEQTSANLLRVMIDTAEAEDGILYVDPAGDVVFRDRHHDFDAAPTLDFGSAGYEVASVEPRYGASTIVNIGRTELASGDVYEVIDDASVTAYGPRSWTTRDLSLSAAESEGLAQWAVVRWAEPKLNLDGVKVHGHADSGASLPTLLAARLGDVADFTHTPPGGGTTEMTGRVTQIEHTIGKNEWAMVTNLASWHGEGPWFTIGDATLGVIGTTNKLAP